MAVHFVNAAASQRQQIVQRFGNIDAEQEHWHGSQNQRQPATERQPELFPRFPLRNGDSSARRFVHSPARQKPSD